MAETSLNPFVRKTEEYRRDLNILDIYVKDTATYLSLSTKRPFSECEKFVREKLKPNQEFAFKSPTVECLVRKENGDREKVVTNLYSYIQSAINSNELISPTLTTYINPEIKTSVLSYYIDENVKLRGLSKKAMFAAQASGDHLLAAIKKIEQTNKKLANNAISGAHVTPTTPLFNKTAHSTLTSACRTTSGYGNANNEKFIIGNRHYWSSQIVINNIISIINNVDYDLISNVISKYKLAYPSVEDVIRCIDYSSRLYWWSREADEQIKTLVNNLSPIQRASFVYVGDLYHLKENNPEVVRTFISKLATKVIDVCDDPDKVIKNSPEGYITLAHQICADETRGIGKDYALIKDTQAYHTLTCTISNIANTVLEYSDLINALWVTPNVPASVAHFPTSIRRCVVTSDTDSTIFTVQDWVMWYKNKLSFDDEAYSVAAVIIFLASATITHVLALMSANFGISQKRLFQIEMKNEFKFDVFVPTQLGKHYYATISCQEGNIKKDFETEIKGVYLKSSNAPIPITKKATKMMEEIMLEVRTVGSISINKYLKTIADTERAIIDSIYKAEITYLRTGSVKNPASYTKGPDKSPYLNHIFWNEVFGPKYGEMPDPPYSTLKFSLTTDNASSFSSWVNSIEDRDLANRLTSWMLKHEKTYISTMNFPIQALQMRGVPSEVASIINYRKIVGDICKIFYLILETLGFYLHEDNVKRLVSDFY